MIKSALWVVSRSTPGRQGALFQVRRPHARGWRALTQVRTEKPRWIDKSAHSPRQHPPAAAHYPCRVAERQKQNHPHPGHPATNPTTKPRPGRGARARGGRGTGRRQRTGPCARVCPRSATRRPALPRRAAAGGQRARGWVPWTPDTLSAPCLPTPVPRSHLPPLPTPPPGSVDPHARTHIRMCAAAPRIYTHRHPLINRSRYGLLMLELQPSRILLCCACSPSPCAFQSVSHY